MKAQGVRLRNISVRKFMCLFLCGVVASEVMILLIGLALTENMRLVFFGAVMAVIFFVWLLLFLYYFQRKLVVFTDSLCRSLDDMMDSETRPQIDYEAETLLSRLTHRMERLYNVMRESRLRVEAERADLQALVSDISHQTKTSIANLRMINDTLLTREVSKEARGEFLRAGASQLEKLDFLIQSMVKTSRLETGVITLKKERTPISDTLVDAVNGIMAAMEKKKIALSVDCPEELETAHDRRWTSEALFNLLDNAVKYTPEKGHIHVKVTMWEMYLKIDVTDTGRGIPENVQGAIFRRFYREEAVHDVDGIGIGLYLAREIITMQGGYIKVASRVGRGSTFSVFLPIE